MPESRMIYPARGVRSFLACVGAILGCLSGVVDVAAQEYRPSDDQRNKSLQLPANSRLRASSEAREIFRRAPQKHGRLRESATQASVAKHQKNSSPSHLSQPALDAMGSRQAAQVRPSHLPTSSGKAPMAQASFRRPSSTGLINQEPVPEAEETPVERQGSGAISAVLPTDETADKRQEQEEDDQPEEDETQPWRLFPGKRHDRPLVIHGWLDQGYTWNPGRPADGTNGLLGMNDRANDYLFNQLGLSFERPLSDAGGDRRLGLRMDMMFGSDARFVQSHGFDNTWTSSGYFSIAMPQLYLDWHLPEANPWGEGATLRVGRFWSPIGYEGVPAMDRYFYSATNAFMLAQPSTHTGAMLQMPLGTNWTAQFGVVQGWDVWKDNNNSLAGLGTLGWTNDDETWTVTHVLYFGDQDDVLNDNQITYELITTRAITDRWNYVGWFDFNFAEEIAADRFGNPDEGQWLSLNQAWIYSINEQWSAGTRFEWLHDDDGLRIKNPVTGSLLGSGDLFGWTIGANYTPNQNWILRPEIRWDWASGAVPFDDPFDDQSSRDQLTAAMDLILLF